MPNKSVREMNWLERLHYSLSSKLFHTILIFSIILGLVAVGFGFYLYSMAVNEQYSAKALNIAKTSTIAIKNELGLKYVNKVIDVYESLNEEEVANKDDEAYSTYFEEVVDYNYENITRILRQIASENDIDYIYLGVIDKSTNHIIYVFDTEDGYPGYWDEVNGRIIRALDRDKSDSIYRSENPYVILRDEVYGYICTSWDILEDNDKYKVITFADVDMNKAEVKGRTFLWQYFLLLFVVTLIMDFIIVQLLKKRVVKPIVDMNEAARNYSIDRSKGNEASNHFESLDIHTGDEIESLKLMMADMENDINKYIDNIENITAEKERIGAELNIASQIQEGVLPSIFPAFPERTEFDVYASMNPAKEVGGDFYDFFLVDDNHLGVVIADVSGKGIPAALFMMATKILISNNTAMYMDDPAKVLQSVNASVCANNKAGMFVTVWLGILDITTGLLKAANAGHEYPAICKHGDEFKLYTDKHGFVVGGMDESVYRSYEIQLQEGDQVFVYTDGVPEATNANQELFGTDRMLEALNESKDKDLKTVLEHMQVRIDEFVGEAPQFDDITMLLVRYKGSNNMENKMIDEMTVEATIENVRTVTEFVDERLEKLDCPLKVQTQIDVAIDELFSNIALYAYNPETGPATVRVEIDEDPLAVIITFMDHGKPYDPLTTKEPDVNATLDERQPGGLGVFLVKKTMDDVSYEYKDGHNILKIKKHL